MPAWECTGYSGACNRLLLVIFKAALFPTPGSGSKTSVAVEGGRGRRVAVTTRILSPPCGSRHLGSALAKCHISTTCEGGWEATRRLLKVFIRAACQLGFFLFSPALLHCAGAHAVSVFLSFIFSVFQVVCIILNPTLSSPSRAACVPSLQLWFCL